MRHVDKQKIKIEKGVDRDEWAIRPKQHIETWYEKQIAPMKVGDSFELQGAYMEIVNPVKNAFAHKGWKCSMRTKRQKERNYEKRIFRFWRIA